MLLLIIAGLPAALFLIWVIRFRYPPWDVPQTLCYHKLSDRFLFEGTWTTPARFAGHIDHLIESGYEVIGESSYLDRLASPCEGGAKQLLLTFDDAYEELHKFYLEVLEPRRVPLLVFVVSDYVGRQNTWDLSLGRPPARHLGWGQITELARKGVCFGSHGASHIDLTRASLPEVERETAASKLALEERIGAPVRSFSYPFGRYDARAQQAVRDAGYAAAFSLYPRHHNGTIDRMALRRNGVYIIDTRQTLSWKLAPGPFYWFEEMKCRTINAVAALTPLLRHSPGARSPEYHAGGRDR